MHPLAAPSRAAWLRPGALVVLVSAGAVAALTVGLPTAEVLRADVGAFGAAAPVVLVLVYAAATLAPLPRSVLSAACGLLLGLAGGALVAFAGTLLGAVAGFGLGRLLGRDAVLRMTRGRAAHIDRLLARRGLVAVLLARLLPVVPFTAVTYAAGLSGVRFRHYLLGTALGVVPGTIAYVALGAYGTAPATWPVAVAVVVLALGGGVVVRWISFRRAAAEPADSGSMSFATAPRRPDDGTQRSSGDSVAAQFSGGIPE